MQVSALDGGTAHLQYIVLPPPPDIRVSESWLVSWALWVAASRGLPCGVEGSAPGYLQSIFPIFLSRDG